MKRIIQDEAWVGHEAELGRLRHAVRKRESVLIWGPADAGKTTLVRKLLSELVAEERSKYINLTGPMILQELLRQMVIRLCEADDRYVLGKIRGDGADSRAMKRWLSKQPSLRLRGILYRALAQVPYWIFLDHLPPLSHVAARVVKEVIWRCKTPVYLLARACSQHEIGYARSLYWTDCYRIYVGPLPQNKARELLDMCVRKFCLRFLNLEDFREQVLCLSGHLPGAIVKMCALAAAPRYQHGRRIKTSLVHIDYLMSLKMGGVLLHPHSSL